MELIGAENVRSRINTSYKGRVPFLFAVDYELKNGFFIEYPMVQHDILFGFGSVTNSPVREFSGERKSFGISDPDRHKYKEAFEVVINGIRRGDSFLANLTGKTLIDTQWTLEEIFSFSNSRYRLFLPGRFVCFSPEQFISVENGIITSRPMKGTIDAAEERAEEKILGDYKELAEHNTIVDLIRNDLSMVADNVEVAKFRYIDRLETSRGAILQVSSEIRGVLKPQMRDNMGDAIFRMLPAGSICGAPKSSTVSLIAKAERTERGFYTGVMGYFDGAVLDTAVMIRFIEEEGGRMYFRSGGGNNYK